MVQAFVIEPSEQNASLPASSQIAMPQVVVTV
jgi:hypothetical protein